MKPLSLSVVMPAHNEAGSIAPVLTRLAEALEAAGIPHEIVVVDDHSRDGTAVIVQAVSAAHPSIRCIQNLDAPGFGLAVRAGLDAFVNDAVAIVMADGSDAPGDVVRCYEELLKGYDCVFGSRFMRGSQDVDYPRFKLTVNRLANLFVRLLFRIPLNDTTNAFKCYRREVIDGLRPIVSNHFNLTVELPLKAIVRGYTFSTIPISWSNRTEGVSKLKLQEMGSRYLFIVLYVWLEKHLAKGDYSRQRTMHAVAAAEARNPQQPVVK
jgi:dolichol-phosphate mannosyltransferase